MRMDETPDVEHEGLRHFRVSEHLANERTHLAYVRTAIALVGLGITINRFSLFLLQSEPAGTPSTEATVLRDGERVGFGMVALGLAVIAMAIWRYAKVDREIDAGFFKPNQAMVWALSLLVLALGGFSVTWLFLR